MTIDPGRITGTFGSASSLNLMKVVFSFEEIDESLPYIPLAARRVLDSVGAKLSLDAWLSLSMADRKVLILAGIAELVDADIAHAVLARATPAATRMTPVGEPDVLEPPHELVQALGAERPIDVERWSHLRAFDRYALAKYVAKPEKLARAYEEILGSRVVLTHLTASGEANMVDVAPKAATFRRAIASARVKMAPAVLEKIAAGGAAKGDVFAVARVAGIQAAKRTSELIPLCHAIALSRVEVSFAIDRAHGQVLVRTRAEAIDRTGVEMEALTAATVAALTIYDMIKAADRWASIGDVRLEEKMGGKSGDVQRPQEGSR
jgi:molybdenum cofactor biosynthesis protein MoaC